MLRLPHHLAFDFYKDFLHWYCKWAKPSFLEVGCLGGDLCASLETTKSIGIDLNIHADWQTYMDKYAGRVQFYQTSSDEFFKHLDPAVKFGLIFIDGDHHRDQVLKDTYNSLLRLEQDGLICLHDTYPPSVGDTAEHLCGTAYQAAIELRRDSGLEVYTFPVTYGLTLVQPIGVGFPWTL